MEGRINVGGIEHLEKTRIFEEKERATPLLII
jgi:hypothetical protein